MSQFFRSVCKLPGIANNTIKTKKNKRFFRMEAQDNGYLNLQILEEKISKFSIFHDSFRIFVKNVVLNCFFEKN